MTAIFARKAMLPHGWADDAPLRVDDGRITAVTPGAMAEAIDVAAAIIIPGLRNAHSHALQRALAGRTETSAAFAAALGRLGAVQ